MLSLDNHTWNDLDHAYGSASDVPDLLRQLRAHPYRTQNYKDEPWFSLWSSLCHQGDVYTASYAAVPHIIDICCTATGPIDFGFFQLPGCIESARATGRGPDIPETISADYKSAFRRLPECIERHYSHEWDDAMAQSVAVALLAAKGRLKVAEAISEMDSDVMEKLISGDF